MRTAQAVWLVKPGRRGQRRQPQALPVLRAARESDRAACACALAPGRTRCITNGGYASTHILTTLGSGTSYDGDIGVLATALASPKSDATVARTREARAAPLDDMAGLPPSGRALERERRGYAAPPASRGAAGRQHMSCRDTRVGLSYHAVTLAPRAPGVTLRCPQTADALVTQKRTDKLRYHSTHLATQSTTR